MSQKTLTTKKIETAEDLQAAITELIQAAILTNRSHGQGAITGAEVNVDLGETFTHLALVEERLTDGSFVFNINLA